MKLRRTSHRQDLVIRGQFFSVRQNSGPPGFIKPPENSSDQRYLSLVRSRFRAVFFTLHVTRPTLFMKGRATNRTKNGRSAGFRTFVCFTIVSSAPLQLSIRAVIVSYAPEMVTSTQRTEQRADNGTDETRTRTRGRPLHNNNLFVIIFIGDKFDVTTAAKTDLASDNTKSYFYL